MLRSREYANKPTEYQSEAAQRILWRKLRDGRLPSYNKFQLRDEVDHQPSVRGQCLNKDRTPARQFRLARAEKRMDQAPKGLSQRRVGNIALVLIELAGGEKTARRHQRFVQLVDDRGFSDARISRDQHELGRAALNDALERREQGFDLTLSPVKLLRNQQPVRCIVLPERELVNSTLTLPIDKTAMQISLEARGRL